MRKIHASAIIAAALATMNGSLSLADDLYSTGFETSGSSYVVGSSVDPGNGWLSRTGTGTATVTKPATGGRKGVNVVSLADNGTGLNAIERDVPFTLDDIGKYDTQVLGTSGSFRISNAVGGNATTGATVGIEAYDLTHHLMFQSGITWDANNLLGNGANHFYTWFREYSSTADTVGEFYDVDWGPVSASQLNSVGWDDFGIGFIVGEFPSNIYYSESREGGTESFGPVTRTGPNAFVGFNDLDIFWQRESSDGIQPQLFADELSLTDGSDSDTPEPIFLAPISMIVLMVARNRRRC